MSEQDMADFYKNMRRQEGGTIVDGTVVGGGAPAGGDNHHGASAVPAPRKNKPVLGFLFSISNNGKTEFWPLYLGSNIVGSNASDDVYLPEATVSSRHANLVIQKMKNPEKVVAAISDMGSTNGTMLNGASVFVTPTECKLGDKLTFGDHYELLLLLLDPKKLGLAPIEGFMPISDDTKDETEEHFPGGDNSNFEDGTVGVDGNDRFDSGGTVSL